MNQDDKKTTVPSVTHVKNKIPGLAGISTKLISLLAVVGLLAVWAISGYNGLVGSREAVNNKWSSVQSDYQRRSDLIPNLVSTVQGAAAQEKDVLEGVVKARASATSITVNAANAEDLAKYQAAQGQISQALGRLLAVTENYPELKSLEAFRDLQSQLEGTENRIAVSRKDFSTAASSYNTKRAKFPTVVLANLFGFDNRPYFDAEPAAQNAPKVDFNK
jgi:LemA protein